MIKESYYLDYLNNLLEGNKTGCIKVIKELESQKIALDDLYVNLFQRSLYQIGKMWEKGKVTVGEEHTATKLTDFLMTSHFNTLKPARSKNKTVVISCVNKEFHELGAKMIAHLFEYHGWTTYFLGASIPPKELIKYIKTKKPDLVGLSFNFYLNFLKLVEVIEDIKKFYPEQKIILGGQGLKSFEKKLTEDYPEIKLFDSITGVNDYIKNF
jgi:MerR family transcriptional regulator, light-induced transcriptional regulator